MIECKCGNPECKQTVHIQNENGSCAVSFNLNSPNGFLILDANELIKLIREAKAVLVSLADGA